MFVLLHLCHLICLYIYVWMCIICSHLQSLETLSFPLFPFIPHKILGIYAYEREHNKRVEKEKEKEKVLNMKCIAIESLLWPIYVRLHWKFKKNEVKFNLTFAYWFSFYGIKHNVQMGKENANFIAIIVVLLTISHRLYVEQCSNICLWHNSNYEKIRGKNNNCNNRLNSKLY